MHNLITAAETIPEIKKAALIKTRHIIFDPSLRDICKKNQCGGYGMNWSCPPDCGDIQALIDTARSYENALVFQSMWRISDCFDIESMNNAQKKHFKATIKLKNLLSDDLPAGFLPLSVVCQMCKECTKSAEVPCTYPEQRISSLEAYGILVSELAAACGMSYINGENIVTYFGAFLF